LTTDSLISKKEFPLTTCAKKTRSRDPCFSRKSGKRELNHGENRVGLNHDTMQIRERLGSGSGWGYMGNLLLILTP
jgi:hypothetical protein